MADSSAYRTSAHELDDDEIRMLLPRDLLEEIGVVGPAPRRAPDPVDGLAAHLASVLGGAAKKTPCRRHPPVNVGRGSPAGGEGSVRRVAAPPPSPAVPWQAMESLGRNAMVLHPTAIMSALTPPPASRPLTGGAQPPTTAPARRGVGTGVFLPPADDDEAVRRTAAMAAKPPSNGGHARIVHHQRGHKAQAAGMAVIVKTQQQEMLAVGALVEQRYYLGVDPHLELALLPQEWTY